MKKPIAGAQGIAVVHDKNNDGKIESIFISIKTPPNYSAFEVGRIAVTADIYGTEFNNNTFWHMMANQNTPTLVHADPTMLYMSIYLLGEHMDNIVKLPQ